LPICPCSSSSPAAQTATATLTKMTASRPRHQPPDTPSAVAVLSVNGTRGSAAAKCSNHTARQRPNTTGKGL
jgi:hypothetical protein